MRIPSRSEIATISSTVIYHAVVSISGRYTQHFVTACDGDIFVAVTRVQTGTGHGVQC